MSDPRDQTFFKIDTFAEGGMRAAGVQLKVQDYLHIEILVNREMLVARPLFKGDVITIRFQKPREEAPAP